MMIIGENEPAESLGRVETRGKTRNCGSEEMVVFRGVKVRGKYGDW